MVKKSKDEKIKFLSEKMENLPPLSPTFSKIMKLVQDANASARDLTKVISIDAVLSAKVIKLVNSAYFNPTERISSIVRAIIMLGLVTIKNLALSTALVGSFKKEKTQKGMNLDKFWIHSLHCAIISKLIARKAGFSKNDLEEFYLAGLFHDIGKIILNKNFNDEYDEIINSTSYHSENIEDEDDDYFLMLYNMSADKKDSNNSSKYSSYIDAENDLIDLNHCEIGEILCKKWNFPEKLSNVVRYHHDPTEVNNKEHIHLVYCVYLANFFIRKYLPNKDEFDVIQIPEENKIALKHLNISEDEIKEIIKSSKIEMEKATTFLNIINQ